MRQGSWSKTSIDKFKELLFLADIDSLIKSLRENNVPDENLFKIEAAAKLFSKTSDRAPLEKTPLDRALAEVQKYLCNNALIAVLFDKDVVFCVMKKSTQN